MRRKERDTTLGSPRFPRLRSGRALRYAKRRLLRWQPLRKPQCML